MLLRDYFSFLIQIFKAEFKRVKRLITIIILGSFLMFFISFCTNIIKIKVSYNYAGRYVLLPYKRNTQDVEYTLPFQLLNDKSKHEIQANFENTIFINQKNTHEINITNLTLGEEVIMSVDVNPYDDRYLIHETLLDMYRWQLQDIYKVESIRIEIQGTHFDDVDLYIPKSHPLERKASQYDNFLTLQTTDDIDMITEQINKNLTHQHFEYRVDDFSVNDLFISLIASVEMLLLSFSFIIFIVSSSNIGTIMPYFIGEFEDEITLLRLMGLPEHVIFYIFMLTCLSMLVFSLSVSLFVAYLLSWMIALVLKVKLTAVLGKCLFLFFFQSASGLLFSFQSIKKATHEVTYL